jgi:hypothetical protein
LHIGNTILNAGASGVNLVNDGATFISDGHNLSSDDASGLLGADGDLTNTDPMLDPMGLKNNGGPTNTVALLAGCAAINAGDDLLAPPLDQRAFTRAGVSDIGAFEFGRGPLTITSITRMPNGHILLQGTSLPDAVITVQAAPDLNEASYGNLKPPVAADAAGLWQYDDGTAVGQPARFYRATLP